MIKVHMISLYFAPGLLKVSASLIQGKAWWGASSMQTYVYSALWSRPVRLKFHHAYWAALRFL